VLSRCLNCYDAGREGYDCHGLSDQRHLGDAGNGHGITTVQGNTALFKPDSAAADCRITLKFKRRSLVVTQTSTCDFGKYANVDGTYKRVSTSKPVFLFAL
jgi:hypothetical protein